MTSKIRPPSHSSFQETPEQPPELQRQHLTGAAAAALRREAEGDLPDLVRTADPGARTTADGALTANVNADGAAKAPFVAWPTVPPGANFDPEQAAALRSSMHEPNRLGRPAQLTTADQLLADYQQKLREYKADYAGTRSERLRVPFLEAKQRLIDAGLMKGDV